MDCNDTYYQSFFYLPYDQEKINSQMSEYTKRLVDALRFCAVSCSLDWFYFDPYICRLERSLEAQSSEDEF